MPKAPRRKGRRTRTKEIRPLSGLYEAATDTFVHAPAALRHGLLDVVVLNLYVSQVTWCIKRPATASRTPESHCFVDSRDGPLLAFIITPTNKCIGAHFWLLSGYAANARAQVEVAVG
jgi:hypothetical protein